MEARALGGLCHHCYCHHSHDACHVHCGPEFPHLYNRRQPGVTWAGAGPGSTIPDRCVFGNSITPVTFRLFICKVRMVLPASQDCEDLPLEHNCWSHFLV